MSHSATAIEPLAYRIDDAAQALGIGRTKIYELTRQRKLKLVKIGKRSLITAASLKALAEEGAA